MTNNLHEKGQSLLLTALTFVKKCKGSADGNSPDQEGLDALGSAGQKSVACLCKAGLATTQDSIIQ